MPRAKKGEQHSKPAPYTKPEKADDGDDGDDGSPKPPSFTKPKSAYNKTFLTQLVLKVRIDFLLFGRSVSHSHRTQSLTGMRSLEKRARRPPVGPGSSFCG